MADASSCLQDCWIWIESMDAGSSIQGGGSVGDAWVCVDGVRYSVPEGCGVWVSRDVVIVRELEL